MTDSHSILVWADEHRLAERAALYPESQALHVAAWERWGDEEAAPAVRRESYRALWEDPAIFRGYPEMPLALKFKAVTKRVALGVLKHYKARRFEATDPAEVRKAIGKVAAQLSENGHGFLLGDKPTAADVSVAALMEPLTAIAGARGYADDPNWPIVRDYVLRVRPIKTLRRKTRGIKERHFATLEAAFPQEPPAEASPEQDAL